MPSVRTTALALALLVAACEKSGKPTDTGENPDGSTGPLAALQVINGAAAGAVNVLLDGQVAVANVPSGGAKTGAVSAGGHVLEARPVSGGGAGLPLSVSFDSGQTRTVVIVDSSTVLDPDDITDTNAIVPAGASKLRVAHFAANAGAITIRRTQPDWTWPPLEMVTPTFPYRFVIPYLQSTPGDWSVIVSHQGLSDTIAATGAIPVGDGQRRTVVLTDHPAGGIKLLVLDP